jgi:hypothetical protein
MTPSPSPRKPHRFGGLQVRICGKSLSTVGNLICCLPPQHHPKEIHAAVAISDEGELVAIVDDLRKEEVDMWQLTGE